MEADAAIMVVLKSNIGPSSLPITDIWDKINLIPGMAILVTGSQTRCRGRRNPTEHIVSGNEVYWHLVAIQRDIGGQKNFFVYLSSVWQALGVDP